MNLRWFALAGVAGALAAPAAGATESARWSPSFSAAISTAKAAHKLVMVDFYTDWCGWCKRLDKDTYPDPQVQKALDAFVPVRVNAEKEGKAEAAQYKVSGYPTIVFVDGSGTMEAQIVGYLPPEGFAEQLADISAAHRDFAALQARVAKHPEDVDAAGRLANIYGLRDDADHAEPLLQKIEAAHPATTTDAVTRAYNHVGDHYQNAGQFDKAITCFSRAAAIGKSPTDVVYALESEAQCHAALKKRDDAVADLNKALAVQGIGAFDKAQCEQMLKGLQKQ